MGVLALGGAAKTTGISGSCPWPLQAANWRDNASAPQPASVAMTKMKCACSFKNPNLPSFQKKKITTLEPSTRNLLCTSRPTLLKELIFLASFAFKATS